MALYRQIDFNNGTVQDKLGAVGTVTGANLSKRDKGYALETNDSKYIQYDKQLLPNGAFSVVVWSRVHLLDSTRTNVISNNSFELAICPRYSSNLPFLGLGTNNARSWNYITDGKFHCYVFTCPGNAQTDINNSACYVDGIIQSVTSTTATGTQSARTSFNYVGGGNRLAPSYISKLKVYDTVLTQKQIEQEQREFELAKLVLEPKRGFQLNKPTDLSNQKTRGLVAAYSMKPIGNTLVDISGNGKNGTLVGNIVTASSGIKMDSGYINCGATIQASSILCRFKTSHNQEQTLIGGCFPGQYNLMIGYDGKLEVNGTYLRSVTVCNDGLWHSLYATAQGVYYIDGNLVSTVAGSSARVSSFFYIGARNTASVSSLFFKGEIEDIRVYNRELSLQEIKAYHNSFIKQPYLIEDFSDQPADGTNIVPTGWIKGTGNYKVGEFVKKSGNLVVNGDFNNGVTGWTNLTAGDNKGNFNLAPYVGFSQSNILTLYKFYNIRFTAVITSGVLTIMLGVNGTLLRSISSSGTYNLYGVCTVNTTLYMVAGGGGAVGSIDNISVVEIDPLPTIKNRSKYLECTTAGTIAIPSDMAYGTWEFDWYKGGDSNSIEIDMTSQRKTSYGSYAFNVSDAEMIQLYTGGIGSKFTSVNSYIQNFTWYRIKITRTQSGVFTTYIKGGTFGNNWVLVSTTGGSGSNPVTDNTYTTSNFFVCDLDAGDRITNLRLLKGIEV